MREGARLLKVTPDNVGAGCRIAVRREQDGGIWRLDIAAEHQGKGDGRFAAQSVPDEARRRGRSRATMLWIPGPGGPEAFYGWLGFRTTGAEFHGHVVGEIFLT